MSIKIFGKGSDTIELEYEGYDKKREKIQSKNVKNLIIGFSDGTLLEVSHVPPGIWEIKTLLMGHSKITRRDSLLKGEDCTDEVTLEGDITWVLCGRQYKIKLAKKSKLYVKAKDNK